MIAIQWHFKLEQIVCFSHIIADYWLQSNYTQGFHTNSICAFNSNFPYIFLLSNAGKNAQWSTFTEPGSYALFLYSIEEKTCKLLTLSVCRHYKEYHNTICNSNWSVFCSVCKWLALKITPSVIGPTIFPSIYPRGFLSVAFQFIFSSLIQLLKTKIVFSGFFGVFFNGKQKPV